MHIEELDNLYSSTNIIKTVKQRMRRAGPVVCMWDMRNGHKILVEILEEEHHSEDLGEDERIILKRTLGQ